MVIIIPDRGIRNTYTHVDVLIDIVDSLVYRGPGGIDTYGNGVAAPVCFRFFFFGGPYSYSRKERPPNLRINIDFVYRYCFVYMSDLGSELTCMDLGSTPSYSTPLTICISSRWARSHKYMYLNNSINQPINQ